MGMIGWMMNKIKANVIMFILMAVAVFIMTIITGEWKALRDALPSSLTTLFT